MKTATMLLMVGLLLALTACESKYYGGGSRSSDDFRALEQVRKGTQGIRISFLDNAPPDNVFERSTFPIGVELHNRGATDVTNGFVVFGLERAFTELSRESDAKKRIRSLEGKSIFNQAGDKQMMVVNAHALRVQDQSTSQPTSVFATICYQYQTVFSTTVCVDPDIFGQRNQPKVCRNPDNGISVGSGQGGPLAVTKIEPKLFPFDSGRGEEDFKVQPSFIIEFENKGNGQVINKGSVSKVCSSQSIQAEDLNVAHVTAFLSTQDNQLDCNGDLDGQEAIVPIKEVEINEQRISSNSIRCTVSEDQTISSTSDAYTTSLRVVIDYGYTQTISKEISIDRVQTY